MTAPAVDEIEISIFGRGIGEACVIHVGGGRWIVIDCLLSEEKTPVPLDYLRGIGVPAQNIEAILLTHWHDDHIGGAAALVKSATAAEIAIPQAFQNDEFLGYLNLSHPVEGESFNSGVSELRDVLSELQGRGQVPRWCCAERRISGGPMDGYEFEALSPSDSQIDLFLKAIPGWLEKQASGGRLANPKRNDTSVASVITIGDLLILLGADLENSGTTHGWAAVHTGAWKARGQASFFKLPHHGGASGHFAPVWTDMLVGNVFSALAPYNRGKKLPSGSDVARIISW
ncbi:MAG: MBL fold metallo-hydrolase [Erythrobacter sp.]